MTSWREWTFERGKIPFRSNSLPLFSVLVIHCSNTEGKTQQQNTFLSARASLKTVCSEACTIRFRRRMTKSCFFFYFLTCQERLSLFHNKCNLFCSPQKEIQIVTFNCFYSWVLKHILLNFWSAAGRNYE